MSKMSNHIVRQREAGIKEDLTEEIIIVQSAILAEIRNLMSIGRDFEGVMGTRSSTKIMAYAKELEESWDRIKRRLKDDI